MRLLTRSDFDGLACGTIMKEAGIIDSWKFIHPKDIQDGLIEVTDNDILANVPYVEGCNMWFDHHVSETERLGAINFKGESRLAPSAARIVYEYFGGDEKFPQFKDMIHCVDMVDSGDLSVDDIMNPQGWILLGFIMDPRTGLGRFRNFRISNYDLMAQLMDQCRTMSIEEILATPDVQERVETYRIQDELFKEMVSKYTHTEGNVIVTDLRGVTTIYSGNRFMVYSMFPAQNISLWIVDGRARLNCSIAVGYSIINRTAKVNVGSLLLKYGGGGHEKVGTCQVPYDDADRCIKEIVNACKI